MVLWQSNPVASERAEELAARLNCDSKSIFEASVVIPKAVVDSEQRTVTGILCSNAVDLEGEVVDPLGGDFSYFPKQVNAVYWNHDWRMGEKSVPIGKCRRLKLTPKGDLESVTTLSKGGFQDDLLEAIKEGTVQGQSVTFLRQEERPPNASERAKWPGCKNVVVKWKALEYSITPMPMNPAALITAVSKARIRMDSAVRMGLSPSAITQKSVEIVSEPEKKKKLIVIMPSGLVTTREIACVRI